MTARPDLPESELVGEAIAAALLEVHTSIPGIVQSYDATKGTVDVAPAVTRPLQHQDDSFTFETLPVIQNVRVEWPGGGGFELRFPLAPGDVVTLVFSEVDSSRFEESGEVSPPAWYARHGLGAPVARPYNRVAPSSSSPGVAQLVAPSPFCVGSPAAAQFVALANLVKANFDAIKNMFTTWVPVPNDGGAALKTLSSSLVLPDVKATKLKAE